MHYLSKSSRSDWKASRKDYLERKRASGRRSAGHIHRAESQSGRRHGRRRTIAGRAKDTKQRLRRRMCQIGLRDMLTGLVLLETVLWVFYEITCQARQAAGPEVVEAGVWILGVVLAAVFAVFCSRPEMRRIRRKRQLLYLEYAAIILTILIQVWRGPKPVKGAALLPALILAVDRISAFLG